MKILIIGDDQKTIKDLSFCLQVRYQGAAYTSRDNERDALDYIEHELPDFIFLDSALNGADTHSLIQKIRDYSDAPLIVFSDSDSALERARGLEAGADDYISRSFNPMELLARCNALVRRTCGQNFSKERRVSVDGLSINLTTKEVSLNGRTLRLSPIEYSLLSELVKSEGRLVPTRTLIDRVWGPEYVSDESLVKTCVYRLRSKLKPYSDWPDRILNERGFGYRLKK